jgi:hypothetical protein
VTLVPETNYQFATFKKGRFENAGGRIGLVPYHILSCIKFMVERSVPFPDTVIGRKNKDVSVWF